MDGLSEEELQQIGEVLSGFDEVELGYVYGSSLRGSFEDVDVAALLSGEPDSYAAMKLCMELARELEKKFGYGFEFDVKALNHSPPQLRYEVVKTGRLVYEGDVDRASYEARVITEFLDYRETLKWFNEQLLAKT
ncbi:MAG: hypothetical protein MAG715_00183 [Methanonatronarchaeales archaeon]|nr:hypothetical protein [Methanonatronarchaeales archaeon]